MAQVGRISGPLLFANLERNGIDLAFRDTLDKNQLLYLNVKDGKIGVDVNNPINELHIHNTTRTTDLLSTTASLGALDFSTNNIDALVGPINFSSGNSVNISTLETDNIRINDNTISTYRSNADLELRPNGTGIVQIVNNVDIKGNLHSTGDITMDGNIVIGDNLNEDTIDFNADVNSNIIPASNNTYSLGTPTKQWQELYSVLLNGESVSTGNLNVGSLDPYTLRSGNNFYVSVNGDDTNVGDHPNGPFATLKHALSTADASLGGPVNIFIYPGEYQEELPLTVPSNVTIRGMDMRNTIIMPDTSSQSEDVFLLNGETTISDITIKDFFFDSGSNKGYAFKFAPNTVVSTRSPYIQNVTVITQGSSTSASDPRGYASGDAGKGAYIDGASVNSASQEASMLFHSATFITPGVDAISMTNGVRVEWLNCFTYFATKGLYAFNGSTGHLSTDGSTLQYGAELRSIGSASVYGANGATADGADCLMYLIQHNMGYIGSGKFADNDPSRANQTNEITELNSGKIYYQTVDHLGNFRVGDQFIVNQDDGTTSINITEADVNSLGGLTITTNGSTTTVNGDKVETGNIKFSGNTISSTSGDINVDSTGDINFVKDTNITNNLDITGNATIAGSVINLGNESTDTIDFNVGFDQNLEPDISGLYDLGTTTKKWNIGYFNEANISDIKFEGNVVTTTESNADLELYANGTGKILVENNDMQVNNNLTVDGTSNLVNSSITGDVVVTGDRNTLDYHTISGDRYNQNTSTNVPAVSPTPGADSGFYYAKYDGFTYASTTTFDSSIPSNEHQINVSASEFNTALQVGRVSFNSGDFLKIENNDIIIVFKHTATSQYGGVGRTQYSGLTLIYSSLSTYDMTGKTFTFTRGSIYTPPANLTYNLTGNFNVTGDLDVSRTAQFEEIKVDQNFITTTRSNSDLELRASGSGSILFRNNLEINNLSLGDLSSTDPVNVSTKASAEIFDNGDIQIFDNVITTTLSNSNLELRSNGTSTVDLQLIKIDANTIESNKINFGSDVDIDSTGAIKLSAGTSAENPALPGSIRFNTTDNVFEGYGPNVVTFNGIFSADRETSVTVDKFSNNIRMIVDGDFDPTDSSKLAAEFTGDGVSLNGLQVDDILFDSNSITTNVTNSNLELTPNGSGNIVIDDISIEDNKIKNNAASAGVLTVGNSGYGYTKFAGSLGVVVPFGTTAQQPASDPPTGDTRFNTDTQLLETFDGDVYITSAGVATAISEEEFDDLLLEYTLALG